MTPEGKTTPIHLTIGQKLVELPVAHILLFLGLPELHGEVQCAQLTQMEYGARSND